ncbi:hypothetical protein BpHYR1_034638 [Brachionus plicatilis]|uniref:Uncharacterized protein n=1 Tax=Brachionus plicatilis TaxID=10195 RepID=A0A3M7R6Z6_BRAPC|nr:hypothetical protein BpHYR1_034638 [Brachionus plicatilis]
MFQNSRRQDIFPPGSIGKNWLQSSISDESHFFYHMLKTDLTNLLHFFFCQRKETLLLPVD